MSAASHPFDCVETITPDADDLEPRHGNQAYMDLLDLLAPEDGGRVRHVAPVGPFICQWCEREESNSFLLANNHAPDCYRSQHDHECTSMSLTRNHISYYARVLSGTHIPHGCVTATCKHRKINLDCAYDQLGVSILRVAKVWPTHRLTWIQTLLTANGLGPDLVDELKSLA